MGYPWSEGSVLTATDLNEVIGVKHGAVRIGSTGWINNGEIGSVVISMPCSGVSIVNGELCFGARDTSADFWFNLQASGAGGYKSQSTAKYISEIEYLGTGIFLVPSGTTVYKLRVYNTGSFAISGARLSVAINPLSLV